MPYLRILRIGVFAVLAVACFYRLGSTPLWETDEGFAANRAGSFLRHHSFVLSYDDVNDDTPQFIKPPMVYWMVAGLYKTLGYNVWSVRLPTAVCSFLACLLLYLIVRKHLSEVCALWSALLPCTAPIVIWHMRTAMLEMPLIFFTLLTIYLFAYARPTLFMAFLAGCAGGAAIMTKCPAGALSVVVALAVRLVRGPVNRRLPVQCLVMLAVAALPALAFIAAVPAQYKSLLVFGLLENEGRQRISHIPLLRRLVAFAPQFSTELRWHIPAALLGLLCAVPELRKQRIREWLLLTLFLSVPVVVGACKLTIVYPRYMLLAFILVLPFSAYFCARVTASRWCALWLVPFAAMSMRLEPTVLRWAPAAVAILVLAGMQIDSWRPLPWFRATAGSLLLASIAMSSSLSGVAHEWIQRDLASSRYPEIAGLARMAGTLVPPGERLVVGSGFTCHQAIFYSDRAVEAFQHWLLAMASPGATRYGIFVNDESDRVPYMRTDVIARDGPVCLARISLTNSAGVRGIAICPPRKKAAFRASLDLLGIQYTEFTSSFVMTNLPSFDEAEAVAQAEPAMADERTLRRLRHGDYVTYTLPREAAVCGIDLYVTDRENDAAGLKVEVFDRATASWRTVKETTGVAPQLGWTLVHGRLVETSTRVVRFLFEPVLTARVRVVRTAADDFDLARARLFVTGLER